MADKVKPLKMESSATGGTEDDQIPTETNPAEDYLATKGIAFENSDSNLLDVQTSVLTSSLPFSASSITASGLTSGRVVYTTTGGQLTNSANFTYSGSTLGLGGDMDIIDTAGQTVLTVGSGTASSANTVVINGASGGFRRFAVQTAGSNRWLFGASEHTESGSSAGSGFRLSAYNDSAVFIDTPLFIERSSTASPRFTVTGKMNITAASTQPLRLISTGGSLSELRIDSNSTTSYVSLYSNTSVAKLSLITASGGCSLDLEAIPSDGTSFGTVRINRVTNTTSTTTGLEIMRGDNTANVVHRLYSKAASSGVVFNEEGSDIDFRVEGDTNTHLLFLDASTDKIGINTSTIPSGGVGVAKISINGTDVSTSGPHIQFVTSLDNYPVMQILPWTHDNGNLYFDYYWDGSNFKSASTSASFGLRKRSSLFHITAAPATTAGATIDSTLRNALTARSTGEIALNYGLDLSYSTILSEDWICNLVSGNCNWTDASSGTNGTVLISSTLVDQNHWGWVQFSVDSDSDPDVACLHLYTSNIRFGAASLFFECVVNVNTLGTTAQDFTFFIGFGDNTNTASSQVDAIGFLYDKNVNSGNWTLLTSSNSTQTQTSTASAAAAATNVRLGFLVASDGSSVTPYINGTATTAATTNIPTGANRLLGPLIILEKTNGNTTRTVSVDYFKFGSRFTTQR